MSLCRTSIRPSEVPFEAETWGTPIEHEHERIPNVPPDLCVYSGHSWEDAGGGLEICQGLAPAHIHTLPRMGVRLR